jgi:hypothetical protein
MVSQCAKYKIKPLKTNLLKVHCYCISKHLTLSSCKIFTLEIIPVYIVGGEARVLTISVLSSKSRHHRAGSYLIDHFGG